MSCVYDCSRLCLTHPNALFVTQVSYDYEMSALDTAEAAKSNQLPGNGDCLVVHGMYLEGCGWDPEAGLLCESEPKVRV